MKKNENLLTMSEVSAYFGLSESTLRRRIKESRKGLGNFPLPLFRGGQRIVFRRTDIEGWQGEEAITSNDKTNNNNER